MAPRPPSLRPRGDVERPDNTVTLVAAAGGTGDSTAAKTFHNNVQELPSEPEHVRHLARIVAAGLGGVWEPRRR